MSNFAPTALLVMTHRVTGLKYFCKTAQLNTLKYYRGSGHYWKRHLKVHGKDIDVGVLGVYFEEARCLAAAKEFSELHDVANNHEWANLIAENGFDGAPSGANHPMYGKPHPQKGIPRPEMSARYLGELNPMWGKVGAMLGVSKPKGVNSPLYGRKRPEGGGKPSKAVVCLTTQKEFMSVSEAAKSYKGHGTTISKCCLGKSKTAYGMEWAYKETLCQ